ncbi:MAG: major capsid protein [Thermoplasmatales archaeon]
MKIFDKIQLNKPRRSVFDLSHERKFTMNMGDLVPILCQEVIPGDTFRMNLEQLVRFQPMLAPMMHRVNVFTHFFFVPNRIIWNEWEDFITGGEDGTKNPLFPTFSRSANVAKTDFKLTPGSLSDYLGYPVANQPTTAPALVPISQLPYRAYHKIWNEFYRDQNLQEPVNISLSSGSTPLNIQNPDSTSWATRALCIQKRAWEKDYFTSSLPFAQKGQQLSIPLSNSQASVKANDIEIRVGTKRDGANYDIEASDSSLDGEPLYTDLGDVTASSINELRKAFNLQRWLEKNARGGSRYIEQLLVHFGVKSSDARLQRPEYLGGGKTPVTISEVLQNSATESSSPQGNMAGHGVSAGSSHSFKKYFEEHGFVIGIMSVLPRTAYMQGLPKIFNKFDKFDYYWPDFAHLGEQEVKQGELYYDPSSNVNNDKTFGYQPRYTEYRYVMDSVHGDFTGNLDFWHLGRKFENEPQLNQEFIKANPSHRIFAVQDPLEQKLLVNTYCNLQAIRPIPKYGNPGGI